MKIIQNTNQIKIQPSDIDTTQHFWDAFGRTETEISAKWIVRLCNHLGGWHPFSKRMLEDFYNQFRPNESFLFNSLDYNGFIVLNPETNMYYLTVEFVTSCYKSSPKIENNS